MGKLTDEEARLQSIEDNRNAEVKLNEIFNARDSYARGFKGKSKDEIQTEIDNLTIEHTNLSHQLEIVNAKLSGLQYAKNN